MNSQHDHGDIARGIIDANLYMTLGTADEGGQPWVTPVFYATGDYTEFYWVSSLDARHSGNLLERPQVSIVVFDSQVPAYTGQAVYLSAMAQELAGSDLARGLEIFPGPAARGGRAMTPEQLRPPAPYRLYRATVSQQWILCPDPSGGTSGLCAAHERAIDHRTAVTLQAAGEAGTQPSRMRPTDREALLPTHLQATGQTTSTPGSADTS